MERKGWLAVRSRWLHHPPPPRGASNVAGGRRYRGWKIGVRKTAERTIADGTTPPVFRPLLLARRFYLNYSSLHVSLTTTPRVFQITHTLTLVRPPRPLLFHPDYCYFRLFPVEGRRRCSSSTRFVQRFRSILYPLSLFHFLYWNNRTIQRRLI